MKINKNIIMVQYAFLAIFIFSPFLYYYIFAAQNSDETISLNKLRVNVEYHAQDFNDPFTPVEEPVLEVKPDEHKVEIEPPKQLPTFKVNGIFWGGTVAQAIIDDKIVKTGDTISDAKVTKIEKEGVTVLFGGQSYKIPAPGFSKK